MINNFFNEDYKRISKGKDFSAKNGAFIELYKHPELRFLFYSRKSNEKKKLAKIWKYMALNLGRKMGIEIWTKNIGAGLYIGHPYAITINPEVIMGKYVSVHKGCTIGVENRGKRKGVPTIGNNVWIGVNATVVGNISIGNDVLIAPGSFVNCDVPDHSVVFGNPCEIRYSQNATEGYIKQY